MLKRSLKITFRVTQAERQQLKQSAQNSGFSQEGYLRMLIRDRVPKPLPPIEYHKLLRQLHIISNDLHLIAARANSTGFFLTKDYAKNVDELRQILLEIQSAFTLPDQA